MAHLTALDRDALHIYAAVAVQILTAAIFRIPLASYKPLFPLLAFELANETVDLAYEIWPADDRHLQWWAATHDLWNTFAIPILVMFVARHVGARRPSANSDLSD